MAIAFDPEFSDTNESLYLQGVVAVGTTAVEAKAGVSRDPDRQVLRIYNDGPVTVFVGPQGVTASTGEPINRRQSMTMMVRDLGVFLITESATSQCVITELG